MFLDPFYKTTGTVRLLKGRLILGADEGID